MTHNVPTIKPVAVVEPKAHHMLPWILVGIGIIGLLIAVGAASPGNQTADNYDQSVNETEQ